MANNIAPLRLTPLERYFLDDERPGYPMVIVMAIHLRGNVDAESLRIALAATLTQHPLLQSIVVHCGRKSFWHLAEKPELHFDVRPWPTPDEPPICPTRVIDLTRETGAMFRLDYSSENSVLVGWFHHACIDGIGIQDFLADTFAAYAALRPNPEATELPVQRQLQPELLQRRGEYEPPGAKDRRMPLMQKLRDTLAFLRVKAVRIQGRTPAKCLATDIANVVHTRAIERDTVHGLKRVAAAHDASLNDVIMYVYLQQLQEFSGTAAARPTDTFRILVPISLRNPRHDDMPSANVISYLFHIYQRKEICSGRELIVRIRESTKRMISRNEGATLLQGLRIVQAIPHGYRASQWIQQDFATAVLAYVGDLKRMFGNRFPFHRGRAVAGDITIQRVDGIAPVRQNTNLVVSMALYAGEISLNLQNNPAAVSEVEAKQIIDSMVRHLQQIAADEDLFATACAVN